MKIFYSLTFQLFTLTRGALNMQYIMSHEIFKFYLPYVSKDGPRSATPAMLPYSLIDGRHARNMPVELAQLLF